MLTVHHLGISQSERIVWLCEELELPYDFKRYDRTPIGAAPPEYKALHPFGTAPVITDGDFTLGESGAIIEYICQRYAGGWLMAAPDHPDYAQFLYWFHFANASMIAAIMMDFTAQRLGAPVLGHRTDLAFAMANQRLGEVPFFAGNSFTAADIMMAYPFVAASGFISFDFEPYPHIRDFAQRMKERPAFRRARAKAEPQLSS
jgi:glutathione S-transferase